MLVSGIQQCDSVTHITYWVPSLLMFSPTWLNSVGVRALFCSVERGKCLNYKLYHNSEIRGIAVNDKNSSKFLLEAGSH